MTIFLIIYMSKYFGGYELNGYFRDGIDDLRLG